MNRYAHRHPWWSVVQTSVIVSMVVVLFLGCSGADGGRREVTGTISLDGQPLEGGWIYFRPTGKGHSSAGEISEGRFEIPAKQGLMAGTYKVAIEYLESTGRMRKVYTGEQIEEQKQIIPSQYNDRTTLTAEIDETGQNHLEFDLNSK